MTGTPAAPAAPAGAPRPLPVPMGMGGPMSMGGPQYSLIPGAVPGPAPPTPGVSWTVEKSKGVKADGYRVDHCRKSKPGFSRIGGVLVM